MARRKKKITILVPCYDEQDALPELFKRLLKLVKSQNKYAWQLLFVNDGSTDKTRELIERKSRSNKIISYIHLSRHFGKEIAMAAGIDHVSSDALVIIDADLQDPPELIPKMIKHWEDGYDDVYARRRSRKKEPLPRRLASKLYYALLKISTKIPIQQDAGDFRLLDKKCIEALKSFREVNRNTKALFSWIGYRKREILYDRNARSSGKTKWSYRELIWLAMDGILSFTIAPLRLAILLGFIVAISAFVYTVVIFAKTIIFGIDMPGYASLMSIILFLGGIQLITIGIVGIYVGKITTETKNRPLYLVESKKINK